MGKFIPFFLLSLLCSCTSTNDSQENKQNIAKAHVKKDESLVQYQHDPLPQTTKKTEMLTCPWLSNVTAKNIIVKSSEPVGEIKVVDLMDENSGYNYIGCTFNRLSLKIYSEKDAKVLLKRWKSFNNPSTFVAQDDIGTGALIEYPSLLNKNGLKEPTAIIFFQGGKAVVLRVEMYMAKATVESLKTAAKEISKKLRK